MLVNSGIKFLKYYLDISKAEQTLRLKDRKSDPLKQWKVSPIDNLAIKNWKAYGQARDEMLRRTHKPVTPWTLVCTDDKRSARINIIKDLLSRLHYAGKDVELTLPDRHIVFPYDESIAEGGILAK